MSECDREGSIMRRPWPTGDCRAVVKIFRIVSADGRAASAAPTVQETLQRDRVKYFARETSPSERAGGEGHAN